MCKRHRQYYHICKECYSKQSPELQQKLKAAAKSYNLGGFLGVFIMIGGTIIAGILANLIFKATGVSLEWMVFVTIGVGIVVILVTSIKSTKRFQALLVDVVPKSST
jgi:sensor histidine kinase YesM